MEPKSIGVVGVGVGVMTATGIYDSPALLVLLIMASAAGTIASLSIAEHGRPRETPRSMTDIIRQLITGFCAGLLVTPLIIMEWQPGPPYRPEYVGATAFSIGLLAWLVLDWLLPPILQRLVQIISLWRSGGQP